MAINPADQEAILERLAAVRREIAQLSGAVARFEAATRSANQTSITREVAAVGSVMANLQNLLATIAGSGVQTPTTTAASRVFRITNIRANGNPIASGGPTPGTVVASVGVKPA